MSRHGAVGESPRTGMEWYPFPADTRGMFTRLRQRLGDLIKAPQYRGADETFWQAQRRLSFKPRKRSVGKARP